MERINVGSVKINKFVLGAGRLGDKKTKKECFNILDRYLDLCYNTLDVARSYENGQAEEFLGEYLKNKNREDVILISKGGFPKDKTKMHLPRLSKEELQSDLDASLKALNTDYIDIYFLHRDDVLKSPEELIVTANEFIKQGKVKEIGASNWTAGRIETANNYALKNNLQPFTVSQINYSLAQTTPALTGDITHVVMNDIEYAWYKETQFPLIAYSVQAKGFFSKQITGEILKPSGQKSYLPLKENFRRFDRINQLAKEKNESIPALLMSYVLSKGLNASVIGGFSTVEQLNDAEKGINIKLAEKEINFLEKGI